MHITSNKIQEKFTAIRSTLSERGLRLWAAAEAVSLGYGGIKLVAMVTGLSSRTVNRGIAELANPRGLPLPASASRHKGGGRKKITAKAPTLLDDLNRLVDPVTRGDPESPLRWTAKSMVKLAAELSAKGHKISARSVAALLKSQNFSLQAMRKTKEGGTSEFRNQQFENIAKLVKEFQTEGQPVVSIDAKKKELVGTFTNKGKEWQPKGKPEEANVYDFVDQTLGKVTPYGIYDLQQNVGWVSVGVDHDTAEFAVNSLRTWWREMGRTCYPDASKLMITADGGGSNGSRVRLWKVALQNFAQETGLEIQVCHFPPGTSKWNKIEHRMFSYISINWRGRALATREIIVSLIGATMTKAGLKIFAALDEGIYPTGKKVTDDELAAVNVRYAKFQPKWNYTIAPK
jgi:hypothetical protein